MGIPTHEDAKVLLDLFRLRQDARLQEAESWFLRDFRPGEWSDLNTRYPVGTPERARLQTVLRYWEMVGALVDHGLMNDDLLFDVLENAEPIWQRIEPWIGGARAEGGLDTWENIELLVARQHHWKQQHRPKANRL